MWESGIRGKVLGLPGLKMTPKSPIPAFSHSIPEGNEDWECAGPGADAAGVWQNEFRFLGSAGGNSWSFWEKPLEKGGMLEGTLPAGWEAQGWIGNLRRRREHPRGAEILNPGRDSLSDPTVCMERAFPSGIADIPRNQQHSGIRVGTNKTDFSSLYPQIPNFLEYFQLETDQLPARNKPPSQGMLNPRKMLS